MKSADNNFSLKSYWPSFVLALFFVAFVVQQMYLFFPRVAHADQAGQLVNTKDILYTQNEAGIHPSAEATAGGFANDADYLRESMKCDGWKGRPIDAVRFRDAPPGKVTAVDNTRPAAAAELGIDQIPVYVHEELELLNKKGVKALGSEIRKVLGGDPSRLDSLSEIFGTDPNKLRGLRVGEIADRLTSIDGRPPTWGDFARVRMANQSPAWIKANPYGGTSIKLAGTPKPPIECAAPPQLCFTEVPPAEKDAARRLAVAEAEKAAEELFKLRKEYIERLKQAGKVTAEEAEELLEGARRARGGAVEQTVKRTILTAAESEGRFAKALRGLKFVGKYAFPPIDVVLTVEWGVSTKEEIANAAEYRTRLNNLAVDAAAAANSLDYIKRLWPRYLAAVRADAQSCKSPDPDRLSAKDLFELIIDWKARITFYNNQYRKNVFLLNQYERTHEYIDNEYLGVAKNYPKSALSYELWHKSKDDRHRDMELLSALQELLVDQPELFEVVIKENNELIRTLIVNATVAPRDCQAGELPECPSDDDGGGSPPSGGAGGVTSACVGVNASEYPVTMWEIGDVGIQACENGQPFGRKSPCFKVNNTADVRCFMVTTRLDPQPHAQCESGPPFNLRSSPGNPVQFASGYSELGYTGRGRSVTSCTPRSGNEQTLRDTPSVVLPEPSSKTSTTEATRWTERLRAYEQRIASQQNRVNSDEMPEQYNQIINEWINEAAKWRREQAR